MADRHEDEARDLADMFAKHEMDTPFFSSTRPYFEKIIADALRRVEEAERERCAKLIWSTGPADLLDYAARESLSAAIRSIPPHGEGT